MQNWKQDGKLASHSEKSPLCSRWLKNSLSDLMMLVDLRAVCEGFTSPVLVKTAIWTRASEIIKITLQF
jgi:hypothetical protein